MLAADTSSLIAYLSGKMGDDVEAVELALHLKSLVLPPVVLCEVLSDPKLPAPLRGFLAEIPVLETTQKFWHRAGALRASLLAKGRKAKLADTLIAQSCIDHDVALITRDTDFRPFAELGGLNLVGSDP